MEPSMFSKMTMSAAILALMLAANSTEGIAKGPSGPTQIKSCGTLSEPGSYVVAQNLTATGDCLVIAADFVTIDLGGFTLTGNGTPGEGITDLTVGHVGVVVRNGAVTQFGFGVRIATGSRHTIEGVRAVNNNVHGMSIGTNSIVRGNTVSGNGNIGMSVDVGSIVSGNIASGNGDDGIAVESGSTVSGNTSTNNGVHGIDVVCPSNVIGNTLLGNTNTNLNTDEIGGACNLFNNL
jgi:parallel beta-helix repeat protein